MPTINDWKKTFAGTLNINWKAVENHLGFELHENLKDLYSRILGGNNRWVNVEGDIKFNPSQLIKEWSNPDFEGWLTDDEVNAGRNFAEFTLCSLNQTDEEYLCKFFNDSFRGDWTGGNDFGRRAYLGEFLLNIGQICLIFNNDSGRFEWVDFGYGYYEAYEDNPYGVIADNAQEFLDKFVLV